LRGEELVALARYLERYAADDRLHGDLPDAVGDGDLLLALGWEEHGGKAPRWIRLEPRDLAARVTNRGGVRITDAHTEQAAALDDVDSYRIGQGHPCSGRRSVSARRIRDEELRAAWDHGRGAQYRAITRELGVQR